MYLALNVMNVKLSSNLMTLLLDVQHVNTSITRNVQTSKKLKEIYGNQKYGDAIFALQAQI